MNKSDLIGAIASELNLPKTTVQKVVSAYHKTVQGALTQGEKVQIAGFGTFQINETKARAGRNPRTGATQMIAAAKRAKFRPGKGLRDSLG